MDDDDKFVTEEWLLSIGGEKLLEAICFRTPPPERLLRFGASGSRAELWEGSNSVYLGFTGTRGQVRRLCVVLGITLYLK